MRKRKKGKLTKISKQEGRRDQREGGKERRRKERS